MKKNVAIAALVASIFGLGEDVSGAYKICCPSADISFGDFKAALAKDSSFGLLGNTDSFDDSSIVRADTPNVEKYTTMGTILTCPYHLTNGSTNATIKVIRSLSSNYSEWSIDTQKQYSSCAVPDHVE